MRSRRRLSTPPIVSACVRSGDVPLVKVNKDAAREHEADEDEKRWD